ncbi:hypothetical protein M2432_001875 [Mycobacterium sp. OTB74]|jgi:hypothetical protein|nr:hypothetical protein [Mycobacterium sp. OTB74]
MTWMKISDDFSDGCRVFSDAAFRIHVAALVFRSRAP